jgi:hypothetical protein
MTKEVMAEQVAMTFDVSVGSLAFHCTSSTDFLLMLPDKATMECAYNGGHPFKAATCLLHFK